VLVVTGVGVFIAAMVVSAVYLPIQAQVVIAVTGVSCVVVGTGYASIKQTQRAKTSISGEITRLQRQVDDLRKKSTEATSELVRVRGRDARVLNDLSQHTKRIQEAVTKSVHANAHERKQVSTVLTHLIRERQGVAVVSADRNSSGEEARDV
jgi:peptidoglycan hydrolase CwlO-like protein